MHIAEQINDTWLLKGNWLGTAGIIGAQIEFLDCTSREDVVVHFIVILEVNC